MARALAVTGSSDLAERPIEVSARIFWLGLAAALATGLAVRLHGLGALGLIVDEGTQALSISGILQHGLPIAPSGWPYTRNLLFQYIQAGSAAWLGVNEYALRLPSAVFGAASILATFELARALFGRRVALASAVVVSLSLWEIALSRYARPYTALQALYTFGLLFYYRGFLLGDRRFRIAFWPTLAVLFSIHEFAVMLASCFAIPLLLGARWSTRRKLGAIAAAIAIGAAWVGYQRAAEALVYYLAEPSGVSHLPAVAALQTGAVRWSGPRLWLPDARGLHELASSAPLALALPAAIAVVSCAVLVLRSPRRDWFRTALLCAALCTAALHQFTLALLCAAADLAVHQRRGDSLRRYVPAGLGVLACLGFWSAALIPSVSGWREAVLPLFGYPNVLQRFLHFFLTGWPVIAFGVSLGAALLAWSLFENRRTERAAFVLGALAVPIAAIGFFRSYFEARYFFHLFPLLVALYCFAAVRLADVLAQRVPGRLRTSAFLGVLVLALLATGEANPTAAWSVGGRDYSTRRDPAKGVISWAPFAEFHQDHKTPSRFVLDHRSPSDRVVVMGAPHMLGVYAYYLGSGSIDFEIALEDVGKMRLRGDRRVGWLTGVPVITQPEEVRAILGHRSDGATWLLADRVLLRDDVEYFDERVKEIVRTLAITPEYVGRDGRTFAVRVP